MIDFRLTETDKAILDRTRAEAVISRRYAREYDDRESEMIPIRSPKPRSSTRTRPRFPRRARRTLQAP